MSGLEVSPSFNLVGVDIPNPLGSLIEYDWVEGSGGLLSVEDPATRETIAHLCEATKDVVDRAVSSAYDAYQTMWASVAPTNRGRLLLRIADRLRASAEQLAVVESIDTGKPISQARGDVEVAARYFEYYGGIADKIQGEVIPQDGPVFAYTTREPLGVVAHIISWNTPLAQFSRGIAPCLAAGNTVVVKPSEIAPISSLLAVRIFAEAGVPKGVCNLVSGRGQSVGEGLVNHPLVEHVAFTGSVPSGVKVLHMAAEKVMSCTLELGGKSPTIVMPDADLEAAVRAGTLAIVRNSGQTCFATTRMLVHRSMIEEFSSKLLDAVSGLKVGRGLDDPDVGPLASAAQLQRVANYVHRAEVEGALVAAGGHQITSKSGGHFFEPTVLLDVTNQMEVAREEVFGPVQSVMVFDDVEEAIEIANDSQYGLAAGIFTRDIGVAHRIAAMLKAGQVQVNQYPLGGVATPFGGYKRSGLGREKGLQALRGYTQTKTVLISLK